MRLLELTCISAVILGAISIFVFPVRNGTLRNGTIIGIVILAILHFLFEGYRWQMVPCYILGVLFTFLMYKKTVISWGKNIYILFLIIWIPLTLLLPIMFPVFNVMPPTGSYKTGTISYQLEHLNDLDELKLTIWYPTDESSGDIAPYFQNVEILKEEVSEKIPSLFFSYLSNIQSNSQKNVSVSLNKSAFSVIVFSPGIPGTSFMYTSLAEELASHGYIVVATDNISLEQPKRTTWVKAQQQAIDFLFEANSKNQHLKGKMDLQRIGLLGYSSGGEAAFEVLPTDERVLSAVNMDGTHLPSLDQMTGKNKPFLYLQSDRDPIKTLMEYGGYVATIKGTKHKSFSDYYLYSPYFSIVDKVNYRKDFQIVSTVVRHFFDRTLSGNEDTMFDQGENPFPRLKFND